MALKLSITEGMTYAEVAKKLQDSTAKSEPALRVSFDDTTSRFFISTKGIGADQNFTLDFSENTALAKQIINDGDAKILTTTNATNGKVIFDGIEIDGLKTNRTTVNGLILDLTQVGGNNSHSPVQSRKTIGHD